jgi:nicotinate-nucleotide pyrophosphorylase (carboxylating)
MSTVAAPVRAITAELLAAVPGVYRAVLSATESGMLAGTRLLDQTAAPQPTGRWQLVRGEGDRVEPGEPILEILGTATEIGVAEDYVLGPLGFAGGVATRARQLRDACPSGLSLACGGWKKLPVAMKPLLRAGLAVAGVSPRLVDVDFVYVPKNTVLLLGGIVESVCAGLRLDHGPVAVQVNDVDQALLAARAGAGIVMVDTGTLDVLAAVDATLRAEGVRERTTIGFGGGVTGEALAAAREAGADVVDVGRAVLDAPLWDLRIEVVREQR